MKLQRKTVGAAKMMETVKGTKKTMDVVNDASSHLHIDNFLYQ